MSDYLSNELYLRDEDGNLHRTESGGQNLDDGAHAVEGTVSSLATQTLIAQGVPVEEQEEIVYYEDDSYRSAVQDM